MFDSEFERNLFELRRDKLKEIEKLGQSAYPNQFPASHSIPDIRAKWGEATAESLEAARVTVAIAGRIMAIRAQGKAGFATLQQGGERVCRFTSASTPSASRPSPSTSSSIWATTSA